MMQLLRRILIIIGIIILCFVTIMICVERNEWTLKKKIYKVSIPIKISNGTITEIEEQARKVTLEKYSNSYLGEIRLLTTSADGFEKLNEGEIDFIYCENLGNGHGFYNYDRFVLCEIRINLKEKMITRIETYGNNQLGGLEKFEKYPEIQEIRDIVHRYCKNVELIDEPYSVTRVYVRILNGEAIFSNFSIKIENGTEIHVNGSIKDSGDRYIFVKSQTQGDGSTVLK